MSDLVRLSLSIEKPLFQRLERLVKRSGYTNRSEFVRDMVRRQLVEAEWERDREVLGTVTLVYDHHQRQLTEKLTALQHRYHGQVLAATHVHMSEHLCAEVILIRARASQVRKLADQMRQQKGVLHAELAMRDRARQGLRPVPAAVCIMVIAAGLACAGRDAPRAHRHAADRPAPAQDDDSGRSHMDFYKRAADDPDWLVRAATFHGHLGPWVTVGAMIGGDAVHRLDTPGQWKLRVVCWMPPQKQQPPFSCILDGLQASSGATMGKQNIRFDYAPDVVTEDQPVVYVVRLAEGDRAAEGLVYRLTDELVGIMARITPSHLEQISREIAGHRVDELFEVRAMNAGELAASEP